MGFIIEDKKLVKYESEPGIIFVVIPEGITEIGEDAFRDCSEIKIVVIPDTVTIIGESAFRNCSGLIKLKLPDSITEIGGCAFRKCSGLTEVVLPPLLKELRHDLFDECANLKKVVIPDGVEKLWGGVFHNCYNLKEVNIPESVTVIGGATFYRCNNLEEIFIPDDVTEIYQGAFTCCINLSKIHLPKKLKSIENEMFYCCEKLREVVIPDGVDSIDEKAFFRSGLERIVIPDSVKYIGWDAFCECKALRSISLPDNDDLKIVAGAFNICPSVEEIRFPKNGKPLKGILGLICDNPWYEKMIIKGNGFIIVNNILYRSDAELINAEVPEGVTYISEYAFTGSKQLVSINIPDSVETVDDDAFDTYDFNKNLETITFGKSGITLSAAVFMHHPNQVIPVREMLYNKAYDTEFDNEYVTTKYRALIDYLSRNEEHDDTLCEYIKENIDKIIHEFINAKEADYISVIADLDGYISQEKIDDYVKEAKRYNNVFESPYTAEVYQTLCDIQKKNAWYN
ncbi:leucine-rich repeat domain-containing protein [Ruminococcus sp. HUN007]|uniref:leucine-rich repeat domain-containing protein n=1 Tax=Ruminococcus sp. HUN007 TaxID=1514668 RepID=UPI0005D28E14|nr:leucine-rich repeat domain-containing protein [Ruminococcus sp. HUN007]